MAELANRELQESVSTGNPGTAGHFSLPVQPANRRKHLSILRFAQPIAVALAVIAIGLAARAENESVQSSLFNQARRSFKNIQYENAISTYSAAVQADPTTETATLAQFEIARCYHYQWSIETAVVHFRAFIDSHPLHPLAAQARKWIGDGYFLLERHAEAIREYEKLLANYPNSKWVPETQYNLGRCHMKMRDWANALSRFQVVIDNYPDSPIASQARIASTQTKTLANDPKITSEP